ncbi:uncharacterized protein L203_106454 [Cryptococcus depauperatus CBS 7841]|uniref:Uncharacterized protein n=1 Tax=Cryptococcus depauperatus CBS 7841 TaxID=1295531 RepID=A0A1E3IIW7_9TREE|nr:hypothetical protein L203_02545 [Cryptococcus depauperatus CBS 7841]
MVLFNTPTISYVDDDQFDNTGSSQAQPGKADLKILVGIHDNTTAEFSPNEDGENEGNKHQWYINSSSAACRVLSPKSQRNNKWSSKAASAFLDKFNGHMGPYRAPTRTLATEHQPPLVDLADFKKMDRNLHDKTVAASEQAASAALKELEAMSGYKGRVNYDIVSDPSDVQSALRGAGKGVRRIGSVNSAMKQERSAQAYSNWNSVADGMTRLLISPGFGPSFRDTSSIGHFTMDGTGRLQLEPRRFETRFGRYPGHECVADTFVDDVTELPLEVAGALRDGFILAQNDAQGVSLPMLVEDSDLSENNLFNFSKQRERNILGVLQEEASAWNTRLENEQHPIRCVVVDDDIFDTVLSRE